MTAIQRAEVDAWVYEQLRAKNGMMRGVGPGIHVMDRAYLDLFAFSKSNAENVKKIKELRTSVITTSGQFEHGQILFLEADEKTLSERQARRGKLKTPTGAIEYDGAKLVAQGEVLKNVYQPDSGAVFNTKDGGCAMTSKQIARLLLLSDYKPFNFEDRMKEIEANGGAP